MKITKLEHSGLIVEEDGQKLVFDPVELSDYRLPELDNVAVIVITHKHGDHLQPEKLQVIMARNPQAKLLTVEDVELDLPDLQRVHAGDQIEVGPFSLGIFGRDHAEIIEGEVPCQNIGVIVNQRLINPGDSFDLPPTEIEHAVLMVPSAAPWSKLAESMDYIEKVRPAFALPVHDAILSDFGKKIYFAWLAKACAKVGAEWLELAPGDEFEF